MTDHIFICEGWQVFHDTFPFFQALNKKNKRFFTDVFSKKNLLRPDIRPLSELSRFSSLNKRAIIYLSFPRHFLKYVINGVLKNYKHIKIVRLYHGIVGPWAKVIQDHYTFLDVIIAASDLDADIWKKNSNYRVETVGWPKGENFLKGYVPRPVDDQSMLISSSWATDKADFRICDELSQLSEYKITFALHPLISARKYSKRRLDPDYIKNQLAKIKQPFVKIAKCEDGILPHMRDKGIMLSAISSSAFEWLLFEKPIIFLREHPALDFGPTMDFSKPISGQIAAVEKNNEYYDRRMAMKEMLISHFDGKFSIRFNQLADQLEHEIGNMQKIFSKVS